MFKMFNQFFAMFTALFSAGENAAQALDNLATASNVLSEEYLNETKDEATIKQIKRKTKIEQAKAKAQQQLEA